MAFEKRDMAGSLFRNDKKDPNNPDHEKFADYTGQLLIRNEEFWLNAWLKTAKNGSKYFSMSIKPKDQQQRGSGPPQGGNRQQYAPQGNQQQTAPQQSQGNHRGGGGPQHSRDYNRDPGPESDIPF